MPNGACRVTSSEDQGCDNMPAGLTCHWSGSIYRYARSVDWLAGKTPKCVSRDVNATRTACGLRPYYLGRVDHVRKIRDRKQRTDIGKYSVANKTIKNRNQLPAEALGTFPCKPKIFRKRVRKTIIKGVK